MCRIDGWLVSIEYVEKGGGVMSFVNDVKKSLTKNHKIGASYYLFVLKYNVFFKIPFTKRNIATVQ